MFVPNQTYTIAGTTFAPTIDQLNSKVIFTGTSACTITLPPNPRAQDAFLVVFGASSVAATLSADATGNAIAYNNAAATTIKAPAGSIIGSVLLAQSVGTKWHISLQTAGTPTVT